MAAATPPLTSELQRRKAELDFFMQLGGNEDDGLDFDPPSDGLTEFVARRAKVAATGQRCAALVDVPSALQTMKDYRLAIHDDAPLGWALPTAKFQYCPLFVRRWCLLDLSKLSSGRSHDAGYVVAGRRLWPLLLAVTTVSAQ
jgi:hypothetical protein